MTSSTTATGRGGLIGFLERTFAEFARLAWVLSGVCDPATVTMRRDQPASRGAR